jgi:hypothetical protein
MVGISRFSSQAGYYNKSYEGRVTVIIQTWEISTQQPHPYTLANLPIVSKINEVTILRQDATTIVNGTIVLPFDKMFRRPINPLQPQEQDITFTDSDLQELAEEIWWFQGLI